MAASIDGACSAEWSSSLFSIGASWTIISSPLSRITFYFLLLHLIVRFNQLRHALLPLFRLFQLADHVHFCSNLFFWSEMWFSILPLEIVIFNFVTGFSLKLLSVCVCSQCLSSVLLRRFVFLLGIRGLNYFLRFLLSQGAPQLLSLKIFYKCGIIQLSRRPPRKSQHEVKSSTKLLWLPSLSYLLRLINSIIRKSNNDPRGALALALLW